MRLNQNKPSVTEHVFRIHMKFCPQVPLFFVACISYSVVGCFWFSKKKKKAEKQYNCHVSNIKNSNFKRDIGLHVYACGFIYDVVTYVHVRVGARALPGWVHCSLRNIMGFPVGHDSKLILPSPVNIAIDIVIYTHRTSLQPNEETGWKGG